MEPAKKRRSFWGLPSTAGAILVGGYAAVAVWTGKPGLGPALALAPIVFFFGGYAFTWPIGAVAVVAVACAGFAVLDLEMAMVVVLGALLVVGGIALFLRR